MVERISVTEAYHKMEQGDDILFLDVRRASWNESDVKLPGALRIEPDEVEQHLGEIPENKEIIAYCT